MKTWQATVQVNYDASHWEIVTVKANTERKARIAVENKLKSNGYFAVQIIAVVESKLPNERSAR